MSQEILGILGQKMPAINTEEVVYSVPQGRRAAISLVLVVNNNTVDALIDFAVVPGGSNDIPNNATADVNRIFKGFTILAKKGGQDAIPISGGGITLDEYDDIRFKTDKAQVVIHIYGVEVASEKS